MKRKIVWVMLGIVPVVSALSACSTLQTTVIPERNHYTIVATAQSGSTARSGAVKKATETCAVQGKKLLVMRQRTVYQGAGKTLGTISEIASQATFLEGGPNLTSTKQADDYKTTMIFRCR